MEKIKIDKKKFLVGGFMITNSSVLAELNILWKQRKKDKDAKYKKDTSYYVDAKNAGGQIFSMDPDDISAGPKNTLDVFVPSGLCFDEDKKQLLVGSDHTIKVIEKGSIVQEINHNLFNCIHGLSKDDKGNVIVVSTGIDTILSLNTLKQTIDITWNANKNGFNQAPYGERTIDLTQNHQGIDYPTMRHTTHINSAINHRKGKILATLFHQGTLIEIDTTTGKTKTILSGLKNPHSIKKHNVYYTLCDTGNGRIYILDDDLSVINKVKTDSHRIQDAQLLDDLSIVYCDGSNGKIERINLDGKTLDKFVFGNSKRIGWIVELQKSYIADIFG